MSKSFVIFLKNIELFPNFIELYNMIKYLFELICDGIDKHDCENCALPSITITVDDFRNYSEAIWDQGWLMVISDRGIKKVYCPDCNKDLNMDGTPRG